MRVWRSVTMNKLTVAKRLGPTVCVTALLLGLLAASSGRRLTSAAPAPSASPVLINGAGATFPYPIYSKWFDEYHQAHSDVQFNYQSVGSGAGIRQVMEKTVDFGASDGPMTDEQLSQAKQ